MKFSFLCTNKLFMNMYTYDIDKLDCRKHVIEGD